MQIYLFGALFFIILLILGRLTLKLSLEAGHYFVKWPKFASQKAR